MLGPVYLHWNGSYETYHAFFAHLRCTLDHINISGLEIGVGDLTVGSDKERASMKAVETCFNKQLHFFAVDILRKMYGLEIGVGDLTVGSDEERASMKAVETCFNKQLHFFAVDILRKMCDDDCRIKSAFQRKCGRILSCVSLMLSDLRRELPNDS